MPGLYILLNALAALRRVTRILPAVKKTSRHGGRAYNVLREQLGGRTLIHNGAAGPHRFDL